MHRFICLLIGLFGLGTHAAMAQDPGLDVEEFQLDNGLTVLVHEDRKLPLVGVAVVYRVGSADEPEGRFGFAHLFEHLLFNGSEHAPDPWRVYMEQLGASTINGSTNFTKTDYFQIVPSTALESVMFLESDRMGFLASQLTQESFDTERNVVKNELRQRYAEPSGRAEIYRYNGLYGADHPFGHVVIGSEADLDAASLEDVQAWHDTYYGPNNAILALAGDIDVEEARELAERYFAEIEPKGITNTTEYQLPARPVSTSQTVVDPDAEDAYIERAWALPGEPSAASELLHFASRIIGSDRRSRLYAHLVEDLQIASDVNTYFWSEGAVTHLIISAEVPDPANLARVEQAIDETVLTLAADGPTPDEVDNVRSSLLTQYRTGLQDVLTVALAIAIDYQRSGNPEMANSQIEAFQSATPEKIRQAVQTWLLSGWHQVTIVPEPDFEATDPVIDRAQGIPMAGVDQLLDIEFPGARQETFRNGMTLALLPRETGGVAARFIIPASRSREGVENPGLSELAINLLNDRIQNDEGLAEVNAVSGLTYLSEQLEVRLEVPVEFFPEALSRLATLVYETDLDPADVARIATRLANSKRNRTLSPASRAGQHLPPLLYGPNSDYSLILNSINGVDALEQYTSADVEAFMDRWWRPDLTTLSVVGPADLDYEAIIRDMRLQNPRGVDPASRQVASVSADPQYGQVLILDRPGQDQDYMQLALLAPDATSPDGYAYDIARRMLLLSLNREIREEEGWSYGVGVATDQSPGERYVRILSNVQSGNLVDAFLRARQILSRFHQTEALDVEQIDVTRRTLINGALTGYQANAILGANSAREISQGRRFDAMTDRMERLSEVTPEQIERVTEEIFDPDRTVAFLAGDADAIRDQLIEAGFDESRIEVLEAEE